MPLRASAIRAGPRIGAHAATARQLPRRRPRRCRRPTSAQTNRSRLSRRPRPRAARTAGTPWPRRRAPGGPGVLVPGETVRPCPLAGPPVALSWCPHCQSRPRVLHLEGEALASNPDRPAGSRASGTSPGRGWTAPGASPRRLEWRHANRRSERGRGDYSRASRCHRETWSRPWLPWIVSRTSPSLRTLGQGRSEDSSCALGRLAVGANPLRQNGQAPRGRIVETLD